MLPSFSQSAWTSQNDWLASSSKMRSNEKKKGVNQSSDFEIKILSAHSAMLPGTVVHGWSGSQNTGNVNNAHDSGSRSSKYHALAQAWKMVAKQAVKYEPTLAKVAPALLLRRDYPSDGLPSSPWLGRRRRAIASWSWRWRTLCACLSHAFKLYCLSHAFNAVFRWFLVLLLQ